MVEMYSDFIGLFELGFVPYRKKLSIALNFLRLSKCGTSLLGNEINCIRSFDWMKQWLKKDVGQARILLALALTACVQGLQAAAVSDGWLNWRGPSQHGVSAETNLPERIVIGGENHIWTADFPGKSTPVAANGRIYIMGYLGEGPDLQEGIACFDAETGKKLWQQLYNDYLSDTIYLRYATASPAIDPETGNVYMQGTQGILAAFSSDGKLLWEHHLMELLGRLTFPNSRTASPVVDGDFVITRGITANWGAQGPGADRFYAFDKITGELVWASSPGGQPKDNSFSHPILGWYQGKRVFYAGTGDGSVVCVNARTGDPLWRVPLFKAGINATVLLHGRDKIIAVYGTPYEMGKMVALKIPNIPQENLKNGPVEISREQCELWSADLSSSTSSPILVGDRVYLVAEKGDLCSVDANSGKILWKLKLGIEQRNSCLLYADGKLYVPILDDPANKAGESGSEAGMKGAFYIVKPSDTEGKILAHIQLDGRCFGTPTAYRGKLYLQTASKLYCFGKPDAKASMTPLPPPEPMPKPGKPASLQIIPAEVLLKPGETATFRIRVLDENGFTVGEKVEPSKVTWASYIPPTAKVRSTMNATFDSQGRLVASPNQIPSAGAFEASYEGLKGYIRGRILPGPQIREDFESFVLSNTTTNVFEPPTPFAYPPLPWIGARVKFEVREKDGTKALVKTIDNKFFQRGFVFIGTSDMSNYTIQADILSEGTRRKMSDAGVIVQRYLVVLKGNEQKLEINSNLERLRFPPGDAMPNFSWRPNTWYRLKARVDMQPDGSGIIRAKAWQRDTAEPEAWTIEFKHRTAHRSGAPGLYAFSPQEMRVYLDNIVVTPN